ncbi:response regulator transcription factor [Pseudoscardovia radai]|uniref:response regulator transcription factor n=1 Tax=Pseudoscardovia radai TaxID=987066 RepID=UPI0039963670
MRILIAEDEKELARAESMVLKVNGYDVDVAYDGAEAINFAATTSYDVIVLDVMMPGVDGIEALRRIRGMGVTTPVIMLTAKAEVDDRITGLDAGADDYLTKPFAMKELLARIRSQARRATTFTPTVLSFDALSLNVGEQQISCESTMRLSSRETKLLEYLMLNAGHALDTKTIFEHVWKDDPTASPELVYVYVSYLRTKLRAVTDRVTIDGERGGSYRLVTLETPGIEPADDAALAADHQAASPTMR